MYICFPFPLRICIKKTVILQEFLFATGLQLAAQREFTMLGHRIRNFGK